jgi:hypothetical protein
LAALEAQLAGDAWLARHAEGSRRAFILECWIDKHAAQHARTTAVDQSAEAPPAEESRWMVRVQAEAKTKIQREAPAATAQGFAGEPSAARASGRATFGGVRGLVQRWNGNTRMSQKSLQCSGLAAAAAVARERVQAAKWAGAGPPLPPLPPPKELEAWFQKQSASEWRCPKCNEYFPTPSKLYAHTGLRHCENQTSTSK